MALDVQIFFQKQHAPLIAIHDAWKLKVCLFFQMICNASRVVTNTIIRWPGSVHDWRIFRLSNIGMRLDQGQYSIGVKVY